MGVALGGILAASGLSNLIGQAVEMASALSEDAEKLGLTVEALQELRLAANQNGVENEALAVSLTRLNKSLGDLQLGSKSATKAFAEIGLSAAQLKGLAPEQALGLIADALNKLPDPQQRIAVGAQIMGKSFAQLLPLINQGSKGIEDYAAQSRAMGEVSTENAKKLDDLADSWAKFKTTILVATANVTAGLIPFFQNWFKELDETRAKAAAVHDAIVNFATGAFAAVKNMVTGISNAIGGTLRKVWDGAIDKIGKLGAAFRWLYDVVVGHSYIPDMVDGIAAEMKRLDGVMVAPVTDATSKAAAAFKDMAGEVGQLLDRLFPKIREVLDYQRDLGLLAQLPASLQDAAGHQLRASLAGVDLSAPGDVTGLDGDFAASVESGALQDGLERLSASLSGVNDKWGEFKDIAHDAFGAVANQLEGVLLGAQNFGDALRNIIGQLAQMALNAAFKALGASIGVPGFATGTLSAPRGLALVGERGPELVRFGGGERVYNNRESGRMMGSGGGNTFNVYANDAKGGREAAGQIAIRLRREMNGPIR